MAVGRPHIKTGLHLHRWLRHAVEFTFSRWSSSGSSQGHLAQSNREGVRVSREVLGGSCNEFQAIASNGVSGMNGNRIRLNRTLERSNVNKYIATPSQEN